MMRSFYEGPFGIRDAILALGGSRAARSGRDTVQKCIVSFSPKAGFLSCSPEARKLELSVNSMQCLRFVRRFCAKGMIHQIDP